MALSLFTQDPFYTNMERAIDRAFNNALSGRFLVPDVSSMTPFTSLAGAHPMDVVETDKHYELHADAPGMNPDDIRVEVHEGTVLISGEHKVEHEKKDKEGKMWRQERQFRKFTRQFALPDNADPDDISAELDKGVLKVCIAKRPESEKPAPKRITVHGGHGKEVQSTTPGTA